MNDDELHAALERRVAGAHLSADDRNDLVRSSRVRATEPPKRSMLPRFAGWLAGATAIVVLALVIAPILLSPPSNSNQPPSTAIAVPTSPPNEGTPAPCPAALTEGQLVRHAQWGVALAPSTGGAVTKVVWPYGYSAKQAGNQLVLVDARGSVVAHTGDTVRLGGGYIDGAWFQCGLLYVLQQGLTTTPVPTSATPHIYSAQELSDMVGDPQWVGHEVLAEAAIDSTGISSETCPPPRACEVGELREVNRRIAVSAGMRDADEGEGVRLETDGGLRWMTSIAIPDGEHLSAFRVQLAGVEYLGPVKSAAAGAWRVPEVKSGANSDAGDDVYAVTGWLVQTPPISCPMPQEGMQTPMPDLGTYYCGGSWLTPGPERTMHPGSNQEFSLVLDDGLHTQIGAYDEFAPDPSHDDQGSVPREGVYLVRNAGCQPVVMGDCPVWRMVGRLETETPTASPSPTPLAAPSGVVFDPPVIHVSNTTTLDVSLFLNGLPAGDYAPGTTQTVDPRAYGSGPWHLVAQTTGGRPLLAFDVDQANIWHTADGEGQEIAGVGGRADLSCGRLDIWAGPPLGGPAPPESFPPGDCDVGSPSPRPNLSPTPSASTIGITLDQAVAIARSLVEPDAQLWGYSAGTFSDVLSRAPAHGQQLQPPDGATWDTLVWGIVFKVAREICPPAPSTSCEPPTDALRTVYLDLFTGNWLETETYAPGAIPLPSPYQSEIVFDPPTIHVDNRTTLDVLISVNGVPTGTFAASSQLTLDPSSTGPAPWHVVATTSSGRQLLDFTFGPESIYHTNTTGGDPLMSSGAGSRADLSCGRLDVWVGVQPLGPAPPPSFPPGDCGP